jgi:hypothetical protein
MSALLHGMTGKDSEGDESAARVERKVVSKGRWITNHTPG